MLHGLCESNKKRLTDERRWRAQVTRAAEHRRKRIIAGALATLELGDFFAFCGDQASGFAQERSCIIRLKFLARRDALCRFNVVGLQKLGCFGTAGSTAAVVIPIDRFCHKMIFHYVSAHNNRNYGV